MAPKKLTDLIAEIKILIIGHHSCTSFNDAQVTRPSDLRNLCLVCKGLRLIAVPQLYHTVHLQLGTYSDISVAGSMNPRNIGLQHVRNLHIYLKDGCCNQVAHAQLVIRVILEILPEDCLEWFSWEELYTFSGDNLVQLWKKQKRLKMLEGTKLDKNVVSEIQKLPRVEDLFRGVKDLHLCPADRDSLAFCAMLVEKTSKIQSLMLRDAFDDDDETIQASEVDDTSVGPGLLTSTIFGHMQPFDKCAPLVLKSVTLARLSLRYAADTYCRIIDFRSVTTLEVFRCPGADAFLAAISKSAGLPLKLEQLLFQHEDNSERNGLGVLDGFLCLVSGITALTIDVVGATALPLPAGIIRHKKTLRALNVHAWEDKKSEDEHVYEYSSISEICTSCEKLEQVAIGFPAVSLLNKEQDSFQNFMGCFWDLPNLVTLNITTWPQTDLRPVTIIRGGNRPSETLPSGTIANVKLPREVYRNLLQGVAQAGFDQADSHAAGRGYSSKLAIIAFGSTNRVVERTDSKRQFIFVKGRQVDPLGQEKALAVELGWCLRKYVDAGPQSGVLDHQLLRQTRPPT
ncbi:hypothetical protein M011DRAFT_430373, partial [Sporormia fimetaria CBS 119925]